MTHFTDEATQEMITGMVKNYRHVKEHRSEDVRVEHVGYQQIELAIYRQLLTSSDPVELARAQRYVYIYTQVLRAIAQIEGIDAASLLAGSTN